MKTCIVIATLFVTFSMTVAQVSLVQAFPNLSFTRPVDLQHAPDGTDRIFVVSQRGDISVFPSSDSTISEKKLFFSLADSLNTGSEEGLLGLTFHPDYKNNGFFYVSYNPAGFPRKSIIARYEVSDDPDKADQSKKTIILELQQPASNHNGGQIAFGPDGYLYLGLGDGGGSNDQYDNGQTLETMLGSMIRINVDDTSSYGNYAIPPDNPFAGNEKGYREEIYAWGLRNPWRWSFDPVTGWLWAGDVGQGTWEEIDIIEKGGNYGWSVMEGGHCFPIGSQCSDSGLIYPVAEYNHTQGIAVTGGYVYRGSKVPDFYGKYIYGDYGSGLMWTIEYGGTGEPVNTFLMASGRTISAFGVDRNNELYICDLGGKIYKFYQPGQNKPDTLQSPLLISPGNNADDVPTDTVDFAWHSVENANTYMLEVSSDNGFVADYFYIETADTFARLALFSGQGMNFFWRVQAANDQDTSAWSSTWKFTTITPFILQAPLLASPENNAVNIPADTVDFTWHAVDNAAMYMLEISSDNGFVADYFHISTTDTFASVVLNAAEGMDFYWHVRAGSVSDTSEWSETRKFTTQQVTALDKIEMHPLSFYLEQNHPNPFNPATKINYRLAAATYVQIKIYDLNGKTIQTLVNGRQNAGRYAVSFDASLLPSGIYFYIMRTSTGFSQSRKMFLLK